MLFGNDFSAFIQLLTTPQTQGMLAGSLNPADPQAWETCALADWSVQTQAQIYTVQQAQLCATVQGLTLTGDLGLTPQLNLPVTMQVSADGTAQVQGTQTINTTATLQDNLPQILIQGTFTLQGVLSAQAIVWTAQGNFSGTDHNCLNNQPPCTAVPFADLAPSQVEITAEQVRITLNLPASGPVSFDVQ